MSVFSSHAQATKAENLASCIAATTVPAEQNAAVRERMDRGLAMGSEWAEALQEDVLVGGIGKVVARARADASRADVNHRGKRVSVSLDCMVTEVGPDGRPRQVRRHVGMMTRAQRAEVYRRTVRSQQARDPLLTALSVCDGPQDRVPGSQHAVDAAGQLELDFAACLAAEGAA